MANGVHTVLAPLQLANDRSLDCMTARDFLTEAESRMKAGNINADAEKIKFVRSCLRGPARRWLSTLDDYKEGKLEVADLTYIEFIKTLGKYFGIDEYKSRMDLRSCLLYTSPSPRDLSTSRMPSSA